MSAVIKPSQPRIRAMRAADISAVLGIERQAYPYPWPEGIFRDCLRVGYCCLVLETDAGVVGYGIMSLRVPEAHVLNVCLQESLRGGGLGRHMLQHMIDEAGARGVDALYLEVRRATPVAPRLYRSSGFMEVGVRRAYYRAVEGREDAVVFMLGLTVGEE